MGFPIRANIFSANSAPHNYFRRFPIQVAVLFSPDDETFVPVFRDLFLHLDQLTGDRVAFFAVLDPPQEWREVAKGRSWWREQQGRVAELGFSFDERPLVSEIGRRFSVEWWEMPVIIVSPNLWAAEYVIVPTSADRIEQQLKGLTELVREWGNPDINQTIHFFEDRLKARVRYVPADSSNRRAFYDFYNVLENYDPKRERLISEKRFEGDVARITRQVQARNGRSALTFSRSRDRDDNSNDADELRDDSVIFDQAATELAGQIIPVATVAKRVYKRLAGERYIATVEALDDTSITMVETSLTVGNFLERLLNGSISDGWRLRTEGPQRSFQEGDIDFSPAAMGIWKMLELETNMSLIQAGRCAFGIKMPNYFMLYDPDFPADRAVIRTGVNDNGDPRRANLNLSDRAHHPRNATFTLGAGWHIVAALREQPNKDFERILWDVLGGQLPKIVMDDWRALIRIRNRASHVNPIDFRDYRTVLNIGSNNKFLEPLMRVKCAMRA
jgi:hypothetical protein